VGDANPSVARLTAATTEATRVLDLNM